MGPIGMYQEENASFCYSSHIDHFPINELPRTAIVAVCVAWWLDRRRQAIEIKKLTEPDYKMYQRGGRREPLPIGDY